MTTSRSRLLNKYINYRPQTKIWDKVMFLHLCVILFTGGVCPTPWMQTPLIAEPPGCRPPLKDTPQMQTPLDADPPPCGRKEWQTPIKIILCPQTAFWGSNKGECIKTCCTHTNNLTSKVRSISVARTNVSLDLYVVLWNRPSNQSRVLHATDALPPQSRESFPFDDKYHSGTATIFNL